MHKMWRSILAIKNVYHALVIVLNISSIDLGWRLFNLDREMIFRKGRKKRKPNEEGSYEVVKPSSE